MQTHFNNALFISDIHLTEDRPDCTRAFFDFLQWIPKSVDALFILGDFFEYWVGDDIQTPLSDQVAFHLSQISQAKNISLYFIAGNRDFSLGKKFCQKCNMTLLMDEYSFKIGKKNIAVTHGDQYCTDDKEYQFFRKIIRNRLVLTFLLNLPAKSRIKIAKNLRAKSQARFAREPVYIDVTESAINNAFKALECDILVHGHTHQADIHTHNSKDKTRMVLGDWHHVGWYGAITDNETYLKQFSIADPKF